MERSTAESRFNIYRKIDNGESTKIATTTDTTYSENLPNDFDRIEYAVSAVNHCGEGELADPVIVRHKGP